MALDIASVDDAIIFELQHAEDVFLSSVRSGVHAVSAFGTQWADLSNRLEDALDRKVISDDTSKLANSVSERITALARGLLDLRLIEDAVSTSHSDEVEKILQEVEPDLSNARIERCSAASTCSSSASSSNPTRRSSPSRPQLTLHDSDIDFFTSPLPLSTPKFRRWLISHIHDPYPSHKTKARLADETQVTVKVVSDWFTNARRKIGWSAISKRYFGGDRYMTIDCAYRVLVERTGHLYYSGDLFQELEDMKEAAEHLYEGQVEQSRIVRKLESVSFSATQDTAGRDRKRRRQASSSSDCESAASSSASYTGESSRKRFRNATEERDGTSGSSERGSLSSRPSSSLSHTASFTSCSSASAASSPGPLTPLSSPAETHSKLPADIFNNWIDDVSSEPVLLPPDAANQPCSVLSQKRALSDSDSHHTAKRARLEQPPVPTATTPVSHPATLPEDNGPLSVANELALSMPPLFDILPIAGEGDASVFGNLPPLEDANPDLFSHFITQLEREVPSASTWDDSLLGGSAVEAVPFNFSGSAAQAGNANTQPASSVDFFSLFGLEGAAGQDNSEAANNPLLEGQAKGVSEAVLLSSTDLAFLDGLGGSEDGDPDTWSTCADSPGDTDSPATLIDTLSSPQEPEVEDEERTKKLRRLQELLEEAEKLKQEVYG